MENKKGKVGRPKLENRKILVNMTIDPNIYSEFRKYCDTNSKSGAGLVERFMESLIKNNQ